jgi:hypothetical protein
MHCTSSRSSRTVRAGRLPVVASALRGSLATAFAVAASAVSLVVISRPAASDDQRAVVAHEPVLIAQAGLDD